MTEPIRVFLDEDLERWIEIRDTAGRLITVLELLSPSNKLAERWRYLEKQSSFIGGRINLVEIDLVRQGRVSSPTPFALLSMQPRRATASVSSGPRLRNSGKCIPSACAKGFPTFGSP